MRYFLKCGDCSERKTRPFFSSESLIKDSAIFKASPLHKLTDEQIRARELIIDRVRSALRNDQTGQLIFIEGEAGTGKTVLNISIFYELIRRGEEQDNGEITCCLIVNHDEQKAVYEQIVSKLGLTQKGNETVYKPTRFINHHSPEDPVDVAFIDEAHLLLTQGKQSYQGKNQLQDILERARVTIVMFDEYQVLTTEQIWEADVLEKYRQRAKDAQNYLTLRRQLRMRAGDEILDWIDSFTKGREIQEIPKSSDDYEIRIFDSPDELEQAIRKKKQAPKGQLCRELSQPTTGNTARSTQTRRRNTGR